MMKMRTYLGIVLLCALLTGCALGDDMNVIVGPQEAGTGSVVTVPVLVNGAANLGAMDIQITYDPSVLTFTGAQMGSMSGNGFVESNAPQAGTALVSFVDTQGISGSGEVVKLSFSVTGASGSSSPLTVDARAYDLDLKDVPLTAMSGMVTVGQPKAGIELAAIIAALGCAFIVFGRRLT